MTIPIKTTGYGITRLEQLIFIATEPTDQYASPFELYQKKILPETGTISDGKIRLCRCAWTNEKDDICTSPGTVLYVPDGNEQGYGQKARETLRTEIANVIIGLIRDAGLSYKSESMIRSAVIANLRPFEIIQERHVVPKEN